MTLRVQGYLVIYGKQAPSGNAAKKAAQNLTAPIERGYRALSLYTWLSSYTSILGDILVFLVIYEHPPGNAAKKAAQNRTAPIERGFGAPLYILTRTWV